MAEPDGPYDPIVDDDDEDDASESWEYRDAEERRILVQARTHIPATVTKVTGKTVSVTVDHLDVMAIPDGKKPSWAVSSSGEGANLRVAMPAFEIEEIPVGWLKCRGGFLTMPLQVGDTGYLHVSDRAFDVWREKGVPCDPVLDVLFPRESSVFVPQLVPDRMEITPDAQYVVLSASGEALGVKIGENAEKAPALADAVLTLLLDMLNAATFTPNDGGAGAIAAMKTFLQTKTAEDIGAAKTLVE